MKRIESVLSDRDSASAPGNRCALLIAIAMTVPVIAIAVVPPQTIPAVSGRSAQEQQELERERWVKVLTSAPEESRWFVGANFGKELSELPEDQAYDILSSCWNEIANSVRPQILKGLCPAFKRTEGVNDRLFDIFHLAYNDPNDRVQEFARAYLNNLTFSFDANDPQAYKTWRATVKGQASDEVIIDEVKQFANRLADLDDSKIAAAVEQIAEAKNNFREFTAMRQAAIEAGMIDQLKKWIEEGKLEQNNHIDSIISTITKSDPPPRKSPAKSAPAAQDSDTPEFQGYPVADLTVGDNKRQRYFLCGPAADQNPPPEGWKLLLILPGGDGSADFNPFCRRIHKNALPAGYLAAELVAPVWSNDQNRVVWPTQKLNPDKAKFTTEQFIQAVVEEVSKRHQIDDRYVFTLGWSSGGPAIYAAALTGDSPVTGTFVAMSVFKPQLLPKLSAAKGHAFYLLHSPQDFINIDQHARLAESELGEAGAKVKLQTYRGGHGWREDPFGHIRRGVQWLESQVDP